MRADGNSRVRLCALDSREAGMSEGDEVSKGCCWSVSGGLSDEKSQQNGHGSDERNWTTDR